MAAHAQLHTFVRDLCLQKFAMWQRVAIYHINNIPSFFFFFFNSENIPERTPSCNVNFIKWLKYYSVRICIYLFRNVHVHMCACTKQRINC